GCAPPPVCGRGGAVPSGGVLDRTWARVAAQLPGGEIMKTGLQLVAALFAAVLPSFAAAGAMEECDGATGDRAAAAKCLVTLDAEIQAALKQADTAAGRAARDIEVATKRPGAYTAFASSSRAFAFYQQGHGDYVRA